MIEVSFLYKLFKKVLKELIGERIKDLYKIYSLLIYLNINIWF